MLMYQLLTGTFPFWDSVANISLQQVGPWACSCTLPSPLMLPHTCLDWHALPWERIVLGSGVPNSCLLQLCMCLRTRHD